MRKAYILPVLAGTVLAVASGVRADSYAFSQQTISSILVTGATVGTTSTATDSSAALNGSGVSFTDVSDAAESYLGAPPPAPQNHFAKYAAPGTFTRGDSQITPAVSLSVVAESSLTPGDSSASGHGAVALTAPLNVASSGAVTFSYNFSNDFLVSSTDGGSAKASNAFIVSVKDAVGNLVFNSSPSINNLGLGAPPNGPEIIRSGTVTVTTQSLAAGTYSATLSLDAESFASLPAVPAPATGCGALGLVGGLAALRIRFNRFPDKPL